MGVLRKCFGDPFVGVVAIIALGMIGSIILSALRQARRERGYRRYVKSRQQRHVE